MTAAYELAWINDNARHLATDSEAYDQLADDRADPEAQPAERTKIRAFCRRLREDPDTIPATMAVRQATQIRSSWLGRAGQ